MGVEMISLQVLLVATAVVLSAAGFTGLLVLDLQGGPTINSFTASISDTNGDGVINPADSPGFSCSVSDPNGIQYISVEQTYPAFESTPSGSGTWGGSPSGSPTTYTFSRNDIGTVLWTGLGKLGGVPGTYTFKCKVTNVNGTSAESSVQSINVAGNCPTCNSPQSWTSCYQSKQSRTNYYCNSTSTYQCYSYQETQACIETSPLSQTSPSPGSSGTCGDGSCGSGENKYSCSRDCGYAADRCNSGQGNGVCESGEDQWNCWKDCGASQPSSCNVDSYQLKSKSSCETAGCTWCSTENVCKAGSSCGAPQQSTQSGSCTFDPRPYKTKDTCQNVGCNWCTSDTTCKAPFESCTGGFATSSTAPTTALTSPLAVAGTSPKPISSPKISPTPVQLKPGHPSITFLGLENPDVIVGETTDVFCEAGDTDGLKEITVKISPPSGSPLTNTEQTEEKSGKASINEYKLSEEGKYLIECTATDSENQDASDSKTIEIGAVKKEQEIIQQPLFTRLLKSPTVLKQGTLSITDPVSAGSLFDLEIPKELAEKGGATRLTIEVSEGIEQPTGIEVKALKGIPEADDKGNQLTDLPSQGQPIVKVMEFISSVQTNSIKQAKIEFALTKEEMETNGMKAEDVALLRFDNGAWSELETVFVEEVEGKFIFSATSPGFSVFVVSKKASSVQAKQEEKTTPTSSKPKVSISCGKDDECVWYAANGCSEDSGAIWRCGNKQSASKLSEVLTAETSCSDIFVPKPKPDVCGCVKGKCKLVEVSSTAEKTIIKSDLLDALLTVEQFKARFSYMGKKSARIAAYYKSISNQNSYSLWSEASESFVSGSDAMESIMLKIKAIKDQPTKTGLDKITKDIDIVVKLLENIEKKVLTAVAG